MTWRSTPLKRNSRRRPTGARRATFAAVALIVGGGGLIAANVYASASEVGRGGANDGEQTVSSETVTIDCPDLGTRLTEVPEPARAEVDKELALLDQQITEAYSRLAGTREAQAEDDGFVQNSILGPLKDKRTAVIDRIKTDLERAGGTAPDGIDELAPCTGMPAEQAQPVADTGDDGAAQNGDSAQPGDGAGQGDDGQAASGPVASDFVDITTVQPNVKEPARQSGASTGGFVTECGVNANKNHNTDNVIVAPGVSNGAHHLHDYVGNQSNDAFATNDSFAAAQTTCRDQDDKSSYYWPVVRVQDGTQDFDQEADGGGKEGNVGRILSAEQAQIKFIGSPTGKVVAMPRFLRIITGDAKAFTNGTANANAHWSCTGFEDKVQLTDAYPLCPQGSKVVRTFAFQSCWDGQNTDSANHRTHVAFADEAGNCAEGFRAIPQLTMRLVYDAPRPAVRDGQVENPYAVDGFPEQLHKPITDHDDFINVMTEGLMDQVVDCINSGRQCGAGADDPSREEPAPSDEPSSGGDTPKDPGKGAGTQTPQPPAGTADTGQNGAGDGGAKNGGAKGDGAKDGGAKDGAAKGDGAKDGGAKGDGGAEDDRAGAGSEVDTAPKAARSDTPTVEQSAADDSGTDTEPVSEQAASTPSETRPQAVTGGLADTGARLWPAAAGAVLVTAGLLLLRRRRA
ncbi:DUF1996 domain-containing protein [Streptomyces nodosus]